MAGRPKAASSLVPGCCLGVLIFIAIVLVLTGPVRVAKPTGHTVAVLEHGFVDHAASVPGAPAAKRAALADAASRRATGVPFRGEPAFRSTLQPSTVEPFAADPGEMPTTAGAPVGLPSGGSSDGARAADGEGADDAGLFDMSMP
mmetsp:Transcript_10209/g.26515  ORF Transcript_10209/g.26515 Transcript_10209/m.26515 type:complete len:145 (-) Transcript_10209:282-716(-)